MSAAQRREFGSAEYRSLYGWGTRHQETSRAVELRLHAMPDCWCRCLYCRERRGELPKDDPVEVIELREGVRQIGRRLVFD